MFCSNAAIDKIISEEKIEKLKQIIKLDWLPLEKSFNEFGLDIVYENDIVFDRLLANVWELWKVILYFKIFREKHQGLLNQEINAVILKIANAIISLFSGKNKSEPVLVSELTLIWNRWMLHEYAEV